MLKIITIDSSDYLKIRTDDPLFAYGMALFETIAIERGQLLFGGDIGNGLFIRHNFWGWARY